MFCPACKSNVPSSGTSEDPIWIDDPIFTPHGMSGSDYIGTTPIKAVHIKQLQEYYTFLCGQLGVTLPNQWVGTSSFTAPRAVSEITQLRIIVEKLLQASSLTLSDYFKSDKYGGTYDNPQTEWTDCNRVSGVPYVSGPLKAIHIEELRRGLYVIPEWKETWEQASAEEKLAYNLSGLLQASWPVGPGGDYLNPNWQITGDHPWHDHFSPAYRAQCFVPAGWNPSHPGSQHAILTYERNFVGSTLQVATTHQADSIGDGSNYGGVSHCDSFSGNNTFLETHLNHRVFPNTFIIFEGSHVFSLNPPSNLVLSWSYLQSISLVVEYIGYKPGASTPYSYVEYRSQDPNGTINYPSTARTIFASGLTLNRNLYTDFKTVLFTEYGENLDTYPTVFITRFWFQMYHVTSIAGYPSNVGAIDSSCSFLFDNLIVRRSFQ